MPILKLYILDCIVMAAFNGIATHDHFSFEQVDAACDRRRRRMFLTGLALFGIAPRIAARAFLAVGAAAAAALLRNDRSGSQSSAYRSH